jgi:hypothetical protein
MQRPQAGDTGDSIARAGSEWLGLCRAEDKLERIGRGRRLAEDHAGNGQMERADTVESDHRDTDTPTGFSRTSGHQGER